MADKQVNPKMQGNNKSNMVRTVIFALILVAFGGLLIANLGASEKKKDDAYGRSRG